ncbi:MAG TPA: GEVED domain-containing protein, partial [Flavipsychrobacter sp.]|nr:GEVED domain-containing protein [Flavipsychrobacter sp.]
MTNQFLQRQVAKCRDWQKLLLCLIFVCYGNLNSHAQNYSVTTTAQCNNIAGGNEIVNFTGATPNANGNGTLTVFFRGDFDGKVAGGEYMDVLGEGSSTILGTTVSSTTGISNTQCAVPYDSIVISIPMSSINSWAADGTITFTADAASGVSASLCYSPSVAFCVYMKLDYPRASGLNDIGIASIDTPGFFCTGNQNIWVTVQNYGINQINSGVVNWTWNGVTQTPFNINQLIDTAQGLNPNSIQLMLGTKTITDADTIVVWTSNPNGGVDTTNTNDTVTKILAPSLSGTYTLNSAQATGSGNYQTFSAFVNDLKNIGICGPVVLNVATGSGPYNEQVVIPQIAGASTTNTITINGNGATLTNAGTTTNYATLRLDGTDYFDINNLTIAATGVTNGFAVHLSNGANNNTFDSCTINASTTTTGTTSCGVVMSGSATSYSTGGANGSNNTFSNCTVTGGYFGMVFYGTSTAGNMSNNILNCHVKDFYLYGTYYLQQGSGTVANNIIERPTRAGLSTFYGVYLGTGCNNTLVEKNLIRNPAGSNPSASFTAYPIYVTSAASLGNENKLYNNVIGNINGIGTRGGMYLTGATYIQVYHNTIVLDHTAQSGSTTYGIYATGTAGVDVKNNNIAITQPNTGTKYLLYFSGAGKTSNHNNLYLNSTGGTNYVAYSSTSSPTTYATLAAWKGASSSAFDQNSIDVDPLFVAPASGNYMPTNALLNDLGTPVGITTDINGATRSPISPDIGAIEFTVAPCMGNPVAGTLAGPLGVCANVPFTLSLTGFTVGSGISISWEESPAGAGVWSPITGATAPSYTPTSGITSATDYRAVVTCANGGGFDVSNTWSISINGFYSCYCIPTTVNGCASGDHITLTDFATINNPTGPCLNASHSDYKSTVAAASIGTTQTYTLTVHVANGGTEYAAGWIDYDQSGTFDTSEFIPLTGGLVGSTWIYSGSVTIPSTAMTGLTALRVRSSYNAIIASNSACSNTYSYGETEDYAVNIYVPGACSGTPNAGIAYAIDSICPAIAFALSDTAFDVGLGIIYEWEESPTGAGLWTPISGATTPNFNVASGITSTTDYRLKVTCANGGGFSYSNSFTVFVNPPMQCYCTPLYTTACGVGDDIKDVIFAGDLPPGINNLNTPCNASGYYDHTNMSATVSPGLTYSGNVTTNYSGNEYVRIWIDTSLDGVFQSTESFATLDNIGNTSTGLFSFTVPQNLAVGSYRMRVRLVYAQSPASTIDPCISYTYGEAHDYTIHVAPPPTCMPITAPTVGTTVFNAATVSWNQSISNPGIGYQWVVVPQGALPSATSITSGLETPGDTIANATGLTASSNYTMYIRAICSSTDTSAWAGVNFTTPCSTFVAPLVEAFNGTTTPNCWTNSGVTPNGWMFGTGYSSPGYDAAGASDHSGISGSTFAWVDGSYVTNNQTATLTSPVIDISTLTNGRLRYFLMSYNPTYTAANGNNKLIVSAWNGTTWVTLDSVQQSLPQGWNQRIAPLSVLGSVTTTQLRFMYTGTASTPFYNDILIDDIAVESTPACSDPLALTVTNIGTSTANIGWGAVTGAPGYQYAITTSSTPPTSGTAATSNSVTGATFTPGSMNYYLHVRTACGGNTFSNWTSLPFMVNNNASGALMLTVNGGCTGNPYNNSAA